MTQKPIYLDHHSTTPIDPKVMEAMLPVLQTEFGNPESRHHRWGLSAAKLVEEARAEIARLLGAAPEEIVFTSGATESNNLAIKGAAEIYRERGNHIITCLTEHKSVFETCRRLERSGFRITYLPVGKDGRLHPPDLKNAITDKTILLTVMTANNEIGVIHPLAEIGRIAREAGILFHTDATQAVGKIPVCVDDLGVDLLSLSSHKMYGPKGAGALYVRSRRPRVRLAPLIDGGGHEKGLRSGTLNVPGIVALGKACQICEQVMPSESRRLAALRDRLREGLLKKLEDVSVNGSLEHRLPHSLNMSFAYVQSESLIKGLKGIAVSSGAACSSAGLESSGVLRALGVTEELIHSSVRFGLGRFNTQDEIDYVIEKVTEAVNALRHESPLYEIAKRGGDNLQHLR